MLQIAIFVDAGYVYAQGSVALGHPKTKRHNLRLNPTTITSALRELAQQVEPNGRLLRFYWYDGLARGAVMNHDQNAIWRTEDVKCRFGTINTYGEQKGVDSLIVTDLIELARLQAISDAIIVSGDEDVRVGVQVAQTFGVRVHLLGLHPAKGSQSMSLIAEADTHHEWAKDRVENWLTVINVEDVSSLPVSQKLPLAAPDAELTSWIVEFALERAELVSPAEARAILEYSETNRNQLPSDFDRPTLAAAGAKIGRDVDALDRKKLRVALRTALEKRGTADG